MGSIDKACIAGFLCRLCSEMHRTVIHIYGDQGRRHGLLEKINGYLPITISPSDPLPKTICESCLRRVEQHYELLLHLAQFKEGKYFQKKKKESQTQTDSSLTRPAPQRASIADSQDDENDSDEINTVDETEFLLNALERQTESFRSGVEVDEIIFTHTP